MVRRAHPIYPAASVRSPSPGWGECGGPTLGIELAPESLAQRLGLEGAVVYRVARGTGADRAGLQGLRQDALGRWKLGDVIVSVDGKPVTSQGELQLVLESRKAGDTVRVGVLRGDRRVEVPVRLGAPAGGG